MSTLDTVPHDRPSRTTAEWLWSRLLPRLPLLPIGVSVFCLSALWYYHANFGIVEPKSVLQLALAGIYRTFGLAPSSLFFLLTVTWCSIWFVTGSFERPLVRMSRLFAMTVMLGVFLNLGDGGVTPEVHKGALGAWLAGTLCSIIGYFPSIVLVWVMTFASLLLATDFFFSDAFERLRGRPAAATEVGVEAAVTDHLRSLSTALTPTGAFATTMPTAAIDGELAEEAADDADGAEPDIAEAAAEADAEADAAEDRVVEAGEWPRRSPAYDAAPARLDVVIDDVDEEPRERVADDAATASFDGIPLEVPVVRDDDSTLAIDGALDVDPRRDGAVAPDADASAEPIVAIPRPEASARPQPASSEGEPKAADAGPRQQGLFASAGADEELIRDAVDLLTGSRRVTASLLQRRLRIDYDQALDLLSQLSARGVVELEADASQGRVLV